jgi:hypothetical protein
MLGTGPGWAYARRSEGLAAWRLAPGAASLVAIGQSAALVPAPCWGDDAAYDSSAFQLPQLGAKLPAAQLPSRAAEMSDVDAQPYQSVRAYMDNGQGDTAARYDAYIFGGFFVKRDSHQKNVCLCAIAANKAKKNLKSERSTHRDS